MPDWLTHILIALIICELFKIKRKSLVLLGALLPDIIFKGVILGNLFSIPLTNLYWFLMPFHLPTGAFLFTVFLTPFFRYNQKKVFILITIGWISHLLADLTAKYLYLFTNEQALLLFPFSWKSFSFNLVWPEKYYLVLILSVIIYFTIIVFRKFNKFGVNTNRHE